MKLPLALSFSIAVSACTGQNVPLNTDLSSPVSAEITRSFALRDRYNAPTHVGATAIFVDSVAVHHVYSEASTIVWKDEAGRWQWSQVSEVGPGGLLPTKRTLETNNERLLSSSEAAALDRFIADRRLYSEKTRSSGAMGVGAPAHTMSIVTPYGRRTISWDGRLEGVSGTIADIVLGKG